jgi:hypothetical protein
MNAKDAEAFILDLYRHLLRRTPKGAELSNWVALLERGLSEVTRDYPGFLRNGRGSLWIETL